MQVNTVEPKDLGGGLKSGMTLKEIDSILGLGIDWNAFGGLFKSYLPENQGLIEETMLNYGNYQFKFKKGLLIDWSKVK